MDNRTKPLMPKHITLANMNLAEDQAFTSPLVSGKRTRRSSRWQRWTFAQDTISGRFPLSTRTNHLLVNFPQSPRMSG
jgi:hypothetical protein